MAEYIEKNAAIAKLTRLEVTEPLSTMIDAKRMLADMPAADVAPVRRGHWKRYSTSMMECTQCGKHVARQRYYHCPNCGAKMEVPNDD